MQRKVLAFLKSGGKLRSGGAFLLKNDLPWDKQIYREKYLPKRTVCV